MPDCHTIEYHFIELSKSSELKEVLDFLDNTAMRDIEEAMRKQDESISSARRIIGLAKVDAAADEIIERVNAGNHPILVGAWHRQVIDGLVEAISDAGISVSSLDGRTSAKWKDILTQEFNDKQLKVLVGQISAMGVSLNLQRGSSHIIVVEEDWSPSIMDQFYARLHRMGQQHGILLLRFLNTINQLVLLRVILDLRLFHLLQHLMRDTVLLLTVLLLQDLF